MESSHTFHIIECLGKGHSELMRDLQRAIDRGQHKQAAFLARKLAALKAEKKRLVDNTILVNLHVEDGTCHVGPMPLQLSPLMSVAELKTQIERDYQLPSVCQRWFIGGAVVPPHEEHRSLAETGVTEGSSVHLYLMHPSADAASFSASPQNMTPQMFLLANSQSSPAQLNDTRQPPDLNAHQRTGAAFPDASQGNDCGRRNTEQRSTVTSASTRMDMDIVQDFENSEKRALENVSKCGTPTEGFATHAARGKSEKLSEHVDTKVSQTEGLSSARASVTTRSSNEEELSSKSLHPSHGGPNVEV